MKRQRTRRPTRRGRAPRAKASRSTEAGLRRRKIAPGETERVAVWLTRGVATRLRLHAATHRMALSVLVERAVSRYLDSADI